jgi:hypothetical protein
MNVIYGSHQNIVVYLKIGTCLLQNYISRKFVKFWCKNGQVVYYSKKIVYLKIVKFYFKVDLR